MRLANIATLNIVELTRVRSRQSLKIGWLKEISHMTEDRIKYL